MVKNEASAQASSVRALSVFVNVLWIAGIILLILSTGHSLFLLLISPSTLMKEKGIVYAGSYYLVLLLSERAVFLWIIYHLKRLLKTVDRGHPFDGGNPVLIRHIAYGFFFWIPLQAIEKVMRKGISYVFGTDYWVGILIFNLVMPLFIGMVILVIAAVFEAGVRMQQDQSLTI